MSNSALVSMCVCVNEIESTAWRKMSIGDFCDKQQHKIVLFHDLKENDQMESEMVTGSQSE